MAGELLLPPSAHGTSCTNTLIAALRDTELKPEVLHVVGISEKELSIEFDLLAKSLPHGARIVLIGPDMGNDSKEELLGEELRFGLRVSIFRHTYQRYLVHCHDAEPPQFVALFHPGLDIHYFAWYPCLRHWLGMRVPVLVTAYNVPGGLAEKPVVVKTLLETLVGTGGGAGMWVIEEENSHSADEGSINAGYFVILGSQGVLPVRAEEMYFPIFQALQKIGHPFAPRVGYLDIGEENVAEKVSRNLLGAIAEGAVRAAQCGEDGCDEETAIDFAKTVLDQALGSGTGDLWAKNIVQRSVCENCGEGFDHEHWHRAICPAVGKEFLRSGDVVQLANLQNDEYNGREGTLQRFDRQKERWVVQLGDKDALFKALNLESPASGCVEIDPSPPESGAAKLSKKAKQKARKAAKD